MVFKKKLRRHYRKGYVSRAVKSYVNKAVHRNVEDKTIITSLGGTFASISNAWTEALICNPAQGTGNYDRIGSMIKITSVELRFVLISSANELVTDDPFDTVRLILGLYDPTYTTPLTSAGVVIGDVISGRENTRSHLIRKYWDKMIFLPVTSTGKGGVGYAPNGREFKYYKRYKKPIPISYGTDAAITYPSKRLILSMISDSAAVPNPGVLHGYCIVHFEDA